MQQTIPWLRKCTMFMVFAALFGISLAPAGAMTMNGKEVTPYVGHFVSHNTRTGEVVIKTAHSTGHWRLSPHTVIMSGKDRLSFPDIWGKTKKVEAYVSKDGEIQRINVLEWK